MLRSCTRRNCGFVSLLPSDGGHQSQTGPSKAFPSSNGLVAQILCEFDDSDDALIGADIQKLERLQSFYDAQLHEVQLRHRAVTEALEARRSIRAPLPRDILIEIFYFVCQSWWRGTDNAWQIDTWGARERRNSLHAEGPLWVLGRVCRFWREMLHTSPASWAQHMVMTMPSPKYALEISRTYLGRTDVHPLTLLFTSGDGEVPPGEEDETLKFLVESCHRWKDVIIETSPYHMRRPEASISHLPTLQTIQIHIHNVYNDDYRSNICLMAPKLQQAKLLNKEFRK
ncbi:hypothetical protein EV421DRAFT_1376901 [Armillaria borealis]|uniref:F-box domain-containing protein n=1 Tax=Armillaria borealis TaxID=47425 RepID=A0AA39J3G2_9AGAR|nr:hypothetical protein EV421DRAFT_1376901 [Armillaria borealis]